VRCDRSNPLAKKSAAIDRRRRRRRKRKTNLHHKTQPANADADASSGGGRATAGRVSGSALPAGRRLRRASAAARAAGSLAGNAAA
jgi:hypothetical protein